MKLINIQLSFAMEYDENTWDLDTLKSWIENKCWEKLVESGGDSVSIFDEDWNVEAGISFDEFGKLQSFGKLR